MSPEDLQKLEMAHMQWLKGIVGITLRKIEKNVKIQIMLSSATSERHDNHEQTLHGRVPKQIFWTDEPKSWNCLNSSKYILSTRKA